MLFWRAKAQKPAEVTVVPDEGAQAAPSQEAVAKSNGAVTVADESKAAPDGAGIESNAETSNVVTLPSMPRLTDRLLEINVKPEAKPAAEKPAAPKLIEPAAAGVLPGQARAVESLSAAMAEVRSGFNILIVGAAGTGRRTAALRAAEVRAKTLPQPQDWVYVASASDPSSFEAFALAHGDGPKLVRDVRSAVAKSAAMLDRIVASDDHRLSVDILEEEHRHRHEHALDNLRRRAEAQNIALVKTADGFVLAPMHEGKVVRSDVFRALPEGLQREVEAKITALEAELTNLVVELPSHEIATDDKHAALARETALRAIKPNLAVTRKVFGGSEAAGGIVDLIENSFVSGAVARVRRQSGAAIDQAWIHALGRNGGDGERIKGAPVVVARDLSPEKLCGVIGHDTAGRVAIRSGELMKANGGFLIVEAWRLAANPDGWDALSTALESGVVTPQTAPGLAVVAEPIPLSVKVILIADDSDWKRLNALDSGIARHFPAIVRFAATAPDAEVSEGEFASLAASIAKTQGLRELDSELSAELYRDGKRRAGSADTISLDLVALAQILIEADRAAGSDGAVHIRAVDIEHASRQHQSSRSPAP